MHSTKTQFDWLFSNYSDALNISEWAKKNVLVKAQTKTLNYDGAPFTMVDILAVSEEWLGEGVHSSTTPVIRAHRAEFHLCAQNISGVTFETWMEIYQNMQTEPLRLVNSQASPDEDDPSSFILRAPSTRKEFVLHDLPAFLFNYFELWFRGVMEEQSLTEQQDNLTRQWSKESLVASSIFTTGIEKAMQDLAATLSTIVQSDTQWYGDSNRTSMFDGKAFIEEGYFRVRWPWTSVILFEVVSAAILLALTIFKTWNEDLPKDSIFALLVHAVHGWDELRAPKPEQLGAWDIWPKG
jgi:hypothetical protein